MVAINKRIIITLVSALAVVGVFAGLKLEQVTEESRKADDIVIAKPGLLETASVGIVKLESLDPDVPENLPPRAQESRSVNIPAKIPAPVPTPAPVPAAVTETSSSTISVKAYLVGDTVTGKIYIEHSSSTLLPIASISKLVTAMTATAFLSSSTPVTITKEEADVPPDASNISPGETYTVAELMYPLLLNSSNVAAEAIASSSNRVDFLKNMSSYSQEVGMLNTSFADPTGLSGYNRSTAKDLFVLSQYLYKYRPDILNLTRTVMTYTATTTSHGSHAFTSIHPFIGDPRFLGGKTGRTLAAGETMITILNINNHPTTFIVLGSDNGAREHDTRLLIDRVLALE